MASTAATSSMASATSGKDTHSSIKLLELMAFEADVELIFEQADTGDKDASVLAHSCILRMNSGVIANALTATSTGNKPQGTSRTAKKIPMPGSSKKDFLVVAPFIYPTLPLPEVTWDNLEVLLVEGRKWDLAVVLAKAEAFIQSNSSKLDMTAGSQEYAVKWLKLADAAALQGACQACVDRIVAIRPSLGMMCSQDCLQGLSPLTLQQFVVALVGKVTTLPVGSITHSSNCNSCYYCGAASSCVCSGCYQARSSIILE